MGIVMDEIEVMILSLGIALVMLGVLAGGIVLMAIVGT